MNLAPEHVEEHAVEEHAENGDKGWWQTEDGGEPKANEDKD